MIFFSCASHLGKPSTPPGTDVARAAAVDSSFQWKRELLLETSCNGWVRLFTLLIRPTCKKHLTVNGCVNGYSSSRLMTDIVIHFVQIYHEVLYQLCVPHILSCAHVGEGGGGGGGRGV